MSQAAEELVREKAHLRGAEEKRLVRLLESIGEGFAKAPRNRRAELVALFHDCAGRFTHCADRDVGALILEVVAEAAKDTELRCLLLNEARYRAHWCTDSASAGGEAIARYAHVRRLNDEIRDCQGPPEPTEPITQFFGPLRPSAPEPEQPVETRAAPSEERRSTPEEQVSAWVNRISLLFRL